MKVLFTVFSASGNTARVCRLFSERLKERGAECETVRIREDMKTPDYAAADVLVIGYPVHGFNAPQNVVDFAKGLPECENKVYYIIKTSGEPLHINDASSRILDRALKKKGYVKKGEFHYVMPYNMIFRHSDDMAALILRSNSSATALSFALRSRSSSARRAASISSACSSNHSFLHDGHSTPGQTNSPFDLKYPLVTNSPCFGHK